MEIRLHKNVTTTPALRKAIQNSNLSERSRLQKVNFSVRGEVNSDSERCGGCNHLKLLVVRLSPLAVIYEFRLFAGDSFINFSNKISSIFLLESIIVNMYTVLSVTLSITLQGGIINSR